MEALLRPYDSVHDEPAALRLWDACLGDRWPISPDAFRYLMTGGSHLVASVDGGVAGLIGVQQQGERGSILAVLVAPAHRRRGIGRSLLAAAQHHLQGQGAATVQLGGGARDFFWCGVPADTPGAWAFFQGCGWVQDETSYDLVGELPTCTTPPRVWDRVRSAGVTVRRAALRPGGGPAFWAHALPGLGAKL